MDARTLVGRAPPKLRLSAGAGEVSYELADDLVAAHGVSPSSAAVMTLAGDEISVEPLAAVDPERLEAATIGPVYRQTPGGGLAVPSGRLFARFAKGDSAGQHEEDLAAAGYLVEDVPSYAPHAAWLRPASGMVVDALNHLDRVRHLPAVEHVEPQLLAVAATRR